MVGQITYTEDQILFVLRLTLDKVKRDVILREYEKRFNKTLTATQLRYVKNKYGHDPEFGSTIIPRPVQSPNHPSSDTSMSAYSLTPIASASHQQPNTPLSPLPTVLSRHPQQSSTQPSTHSHLKPNQPTTCAIPDMLAVAHESVHEEPVWDPKNPYGVQPILQQYMRELRTKSTSKRKREDHDEAIEKKPSLEPNNSDVQHTDPNRFNLESHSSDDNSAFVASNSPQPPDVYQGSEADRILNELLHQVDAEATAQDNTTGAMPAMQIIPTPSAAASMHTMPSISTMQAMPYVQVPWIDFYQPYYTYDLSDFGGTAMGMHFSTPGLDAVSSQSKPSLAFSETDTNSSWRPYENNTDAKYGGNAPNLPNYTIPMLTAFDPAMDPALAPYINPALLGTSSSGGESTRESHNRRGEVTRNKTITPCPVVNPALVPYHIDPHTLGMLSSGTNTTTETHNRRGNIASVGTAQIGDAQEVSQTNADALTGFEWDKMVSFNVNGNANSNNEFQPYTSLE